MSLNPGDCNFVELKRQFMALTIAYRLLNNQAEILVLLPSGVT